MNLTEEQRQRVTAWILQGAKLSEIQNRLQSEFGIKLTYMETRFLMDDLKVTPKDPEPPKVPETKSGSATGAEKSSLKVDPAPAPGGVSVSVDQIARPGAIVSGKVTFSDGQNADWYLDQTGRLGVVPAQQGYKPSQSDVQEFQTALQSELAKMGFA
jgi:hypothetical protein